MLTKLHLIGLKSIHFMVEDGSVAWVYIYHLGNPGSIAGDDN